MVAERNRIIHDLASDMMDSFEEDPVDLIACAKWVVADLIDHGYIIPTDRLTGQCPRCERIIGEHRVDGKCPDLPERAAVDILAAYRHDDPEALADALERLDMADHEPAP